MFKLYLADRYCPAMYEVWVKLYIAVVKDIPVFFCLFFFQTSGKANWEVSTMVISLFNYTEFKNYFLKSSLYNIVLGLCLVQGLEKILNAFHATGPNRPSITSVRSL